MNKKSMIIAGAVAAVVLLITATTMLSRSEKPMEDVKFGNTDKFAVFSTGRMHAKAKASRYLSEQAKKYEQAMIKEYETEKAKLDKEGAEIAKQRGILSNEVYEKKGKEYLAKVDKFQKKFQEKELNLKKAIAAAFKNLEKTIQPILAEVVEKQQYRMVLNGDTGVIFYAQKDDITDEIIEALDDKVSKPDFEKPEGF
jgi:Skp family chaperone for outer membrane proteins